MLGGSGDQRGTGLDSLAAAWRGLFPSPGVSVLPFPRFAKIRGNAEALISDDQSMTPREEALTQVILSELWLVFFRSNVHRQPS